MMIFDKLLVRRTITLGTATLAVTGVLAGCATPGDVGDPALAASVAGNRISEVEVDQAVRVVVDKLQVQPVRARPLVLTVLVRAAQSERVATERQIVISDAQRRAALASAPDLAPLYSTPEGTSFADKFATEVVLTQALGETQLAQACAVYPVVLNPRYGQWSTTAWALEGSTGSLSSAAPRASASR